MNIAGFSAEASLNTASRQYYTAAPDGASASAEPADDRVLPSAMNLHVCEAVTRCCLFDQVQWCCDRVIPWCS
jgi:hypothetical protein